METIEFQESDGTIRKLVGDSGDESVGVAPKWFADDNKWEERGENNCDYCGAVALPGVNCGCVADETIRTLRAQLAELQTAEVLYRDNVAMSEVADQLRGETERLTAENARLREALERIANNYWTSSAAESMRSIARAAMEGELSGNSGELEVKP